MSATSQAVNFEKTRLVLGKVELKVEVAENVERREHGLMFRETLSDREGMIFVFQYIQPLSFWKRDTLIPLSIGFFDGNGKLFQVVDMEPASPIDKTPPIYRSLKPAKFALEVAKGWFARSNVLVGAQLELPQRKDLLKKSK